MQLVLGSQIGRSPATTLPWEQWASLRYTSLAGGRGSCGYQEHICDVNNFMCRAYVTFFYSKIYISYVWFSTSTDNMTLLIKFYIYSQHAAATVPTHLVRFSTFFYVFLRYVAAPPTFCRSTAPPFFYICISANIFVYLRLRTADIYRYIFEWRINPKWPKGSKCRLRGTARIGPMALFHNQGPRAAYPHSYRCHLELILAPGTFRHFLFRTNIRKFKDLVSPNNE